MSKILSKILDKILISPIYLLVFCLFSTNIIYSLCWAVFVLLLTSVFIFTNLQVGRIFIALMSIFVVLYSASYTSVIILSTTQGFFVQSFLFTIAVYTGMLAITYNDYRFWLWNRWLYTAVITAFYSAFKTSYIVSIANASMRDNSPVFRYISGEIVGFLVACFLFLIYYVLVTKNQKKLDYSQTETDELIFITLDNYNIRWTTDSEKGTTPSLYLTNLGNVTKSKVFLHSKVSEAYDKKKQLIVTGNFVSENKINKIPVKGTTAYVYVYLCKNVTEEVVETFKEFIK